MWGPLLKKHWYEKIYLLIPPVEETYFCILAQGLTVLIPSHHFDEPFQGVFIPAPKCIMEKGCNSQRVASMDCRRLRRLQTLAQPLEMPHKSDVQSSSKKTSCTSPTPLPHFLALDHREIQASLWACTDPTIRTAAMGWIGRVAQAYSHYHV